jgi:hypothetical protein
LKIAKKNIELRVKFNKQNIEGEKKEGNKLKKALSFLHKTGIRDYTLIKKEKL